MCRFGLVPLSHIQLLSDVVAHGEFEVSVVDRSVGKKERHGDNRRQSVQIANHNERYCYHGNKDGCDIRFLVWAAL